MELKAEIRKGEGTTHRAASEAVQIAAAAIQYLIDLCPEGSAEEHTEKVDRWRETRRSAFSTSGGCYSG